MKSSLMIVLGSVALGFSLVAGMVWAEGPASTPPRMPGQDAFGAMAEVVRILEADAATDWSKVDMERLRQHLIDMNEVVLRRRPCRAVSPWTLQARGERHRPSARW
jgi:hypothetical protein